MNARAAAVWTAAALCIALGSGNPVYRVLVALVALNMLIALRRPGARVRPLLVAVVVAGVIAELVTVLVSHSGSHALVTVPDAVPVIGGPITAEAVVFGLSTATGIAAAVLAAAVLSIVAEPNDLVDALPPWLTRTGAAIGTALNLLPSLSRSAQEIRDAQRMRGWRPRRVTGWPDMAVPVVLTAIDSSMALAEAMEARGYGDGARTHYAVARWRVADLVIVVVSATAAAVFIALRVAQLAPDWYPFPSLTAPPADVVAVCCCLALSAPLFLARR